MAATSQDLAAFSLHTYILPLELWQLWPWEISTLCVVLYAQQEEELTILSGGLWLRTIPPCGF